ncbi:glutamate racemase [Crocinitomicaceae bacterium]|nr:glutamate racemase [Crocinitomicaceae bacterium]
MIGNKPIGIFDSGYGGLTILTEIKKQLPEYDYLYLGDNARTPYGPRSFDVVYEFTLEAVKELFSRGCELIILACNTASAKALRTLQQEYLPTLEGNKRVLGVIRPSIETISEITTTNHIGILATEGTIKSDSYPIELHKINPRIKVIQHACPMWVPIIENNKHETEAGKLFIKSDLEELLAKDTEIDSIILGCTHYPIIKEYIESVVPSNMKVIAQGSIVASKTKDYLSRHKELASICSKNGSVHYLTTENSLDFDKQATIFLGQLVKSEHIKLG